MKSLTIYLINTIMINNNTVWGVTAGSHDASISVFNQDELVYAAHAERSSRIKNDKNLNETLIQQALTWGYPSKVYWYENHWKKRARQVVAGQWDLAFNKPSPVETMVSGGYLSCNPTSLYSLHDHYTTPTPTDHHHSHAAAGYFTSNFRDAAVLVIDAIGEFETLTIWKGNDTNLTRVFSQRYPHSIGLWYSAMTQRIGLKPNEDEYILMGWAALGDPNKYKDRIFRDFFHPLDHTPNIRQKRNLHRGCKDWAPELNTVQDYADLAAGTQAVYEMIFNHLTWACKRLVRSDNLVIMGGCALNCLANGAAYSIYKNVWVMPNPGDAGSSLGAVLAHTHEFMEWKGPYLGHNIVGNYPVDNLYNELKTTGLAGVANGRAEFGPRALGNRSLLADPRGVDVQDLVNTVKQRQAFRPFAPVILEEHASDYFDGHVGPYMQFVSKCKRPDLFPAISHYDDTSRVQTVTKQQHSGLHALLTKWYKDTGCPMLLNTSLNIKGEPMVDSVEDAQRWEQMYGVKVFTNDKLD